MPSTLPDRRGVVLWGALAAAFLVAQQVAGKATRDALFLVHYPAAALPAVMMTASLVSVACALAVSRLLVARAPHQAVPALVALNALLLLAQYLLAAAAPALAAALLYVQVAATGATLISGYWSVVNERFDPWIAKRVVGRLGLGASLGGVGGGSLAWAGAGTFSVPSMLLVIAALNVAALAALVRFAGDAAPPAAPAPPEAARGWLAAPYLRHIALAVALGAASEALLEFVLKARAAAALPDGAALMAFFAAFHTGMGLLALAFHTLLTRPTLESLGLAGSVALRPAAVAVAAAAGFFDPRLWSAALGRGCHDVMTNSLFRAGYELLYTPLPEAEKRSAKQVVDVAFDKLGALAGGAATFAAVRLFAAPDRAVLPLAGALSLVALGLTRRLHRGYVETLEDSLRAGKVRLDPAEVVDSTTRLTLAGTDLRQMRSALLSEAARRSEAAEGAADALPAHTGSLAQDALLGRIAELRSGEAERIRHALREREAHDLAVEPALVPHLLPLLARNDVYLDVLRALRRLAPRVTGQLLDTLLDPEADPQQRARVPRVLKSCPTQRAADGLLLALEDPSFELRAQCALALAALARAPGVRLPAERVFAAVRRELEARPAPELDHVFTLLSLVLEREPLEIAAWALRGADAALKGTALEYLDNVLPSEIRTALRPHVGAAPAAGRARPRPRDEVLTELMRSAEAPAPGPTRRRRFRPRG
jgi:hypothetical protein